MERVVYILGAGFSAPLGIPCVSDFLSRAKDLYDDHRTTYPHFVDIFGRIQTLGHALNFMRLDLSNVEEILSLLQMQDALTQTDRSAEFARFIGEVVTAYTPAAPSFGPTKDLQAMLREERVWREVMGFVASMVGMRLVLPTPGEPPHRALEERPDVTYSIVTFNYDDVLDRAWEALDALNPVEGRDELTKLEVFRLHGSIRGKNILAPTWSKTLREDVRDVWLSALNRLKHATQIRVLGYSMPVTDVYFRYLLGAAMSESFNLKHFDVVCLDQDDIIKSRYEGVVEAKYLRFMNARVQDYHERIFMTAESVQFANPQVSGFGTVVFRDMEKAHRYFWESGA